MLLSWNPVPLKSMNGKLTAYVIQVQNTGISLHVGSCLSSHRFKRRNFTVDSCFQIAALTKVGRGQLTDCIKFNIGESIMSFPFVLSKCFFFFCGMLIKFEVENLKKKNSFKEDHLIYTCC